MANRDDSATSRRQRVMAAGAEVFPRYGYARTTIGDIARAAGLSRPTVYAAFSDKQQIFEAVIDSLAGAELARIQDGLAELIDLEARLRFACLTWAEPGYRMLEDNPDARDLFDERFAAVRRANKKFEALLAGMLAEAIPAGLDAGPAQLAVMISSAMQGFKSRAASWRALKRLITTLIVTTCAALDATAPASTRP